MTVDTAQKTIEVLVKDRDRWQSRALLAESRLDNAASKMMTVREAELHQSLVHAWAREGEQRDKIASLEAKLRGAQQRIKDLEAKT